MHFQKFSDRNARRLSGLDTGFLSLEMSEQPMQCIALGVVRAGMSGPLALEDLRQRLTDRLDRLPAFRWRVVPVPLGLAQPVVLEDPHFELREHLFHVVLPAPGGPAELDATCAQLASAHLDRNRPLWRITLIDGLADGRQAVVLEVHHALMDGVALRATLAQICSEERPAVPPAPWQRGRMPRRTQLIAAGLAATAHGLVRLPELIGRTRRVSRAVRQRQADAAVKIPEAGIDAPLSIINRGFTAERRVARAAMPLETVLAVRNAAGVTVNDVALALTGGALRGYLEARGALPKRPLVAFVPVGVGESGVASRTAGNRVGRLTTSLATDVADPWERLHRISAVTAEAKACLELVGRELMMDWLECLPPILIRALLRRDQEARRHPGKRKVKLDENVVVSNLRGPATPWRLGSADVEEMYLFGPPNSDVGVTISLWDYAGSLRFGILCFADLVDDAEELAMRLRCSLDELVAAAEVAPTSREVALGSRLKQ